MGSKGSAPAAPNYNELIPLQQQAFDRSFNTMLGSSRINSVTPFGTQTWVPPRGFYQGQGNPGGGTTMNPPMGSPIGVARDVIRNTNFEDPGSNTFQSTFPNGIDPGTTGGGGGPPPGMDPNAWTFIQQLSPEQQQMYDQQLRISNAKGGIAEGMLGQVQDFYGQGIPQFAGQVPQWQDQQYQQQMYQRAPGYQQQQWNGPQYASNVNSRDDAERAILSRQLRYLSPDYAGREEQLHNRLTAQGFNMNDPGYKQSMDSFQAQRDRAMADARDQAIIGGGNEATQELQRGLMTEDPRFRAAQSEGQYGYGQAINDWARQYSNNQAERQFGFNAGMQNQNAALNAALQRIGIQQGDYARPLNTMNSFLTGQQIQLPGTPGTASAPNLQAADPMAAAQQTYNAQLGQYNANQAGQGNFMNGLFGLAGSALGSGLPLGQLFSSSDLRLKTNISKTGKTPGGHNLYIWDWKDGSGVGAGVIAQEVPEAAVEGPDGYLMVDYSKVA